MQSDRVRGTDEREAFPNRTGFAHGDCLRVTALIAFGPDLDGGEAVVGVVLCVCQDENEEAGGGPDAATVRGGPVSGGVDNRGGGVYGGEGEGEG